MQLGGGLYLGGAGGSGTVSSVGLSAPSELTVSNSPVTTTGTLTLVKAVQNANKVWSGPITGADAQPTFRSLVVADLPTVTITKGGTGQITKAAGFDALSPLTTSGDILYGGASGTGIRLAKGADGQVLTLAIGLPSWVTPSGGGGSPGGSSGQFQYNDGAGGFAGDTASTDGSGNWTLTSITLSTVHANSGSVTFSSPIVMGAASTIDLASNSLLNMGTINGANGGTVSSEGGGFRFSLTASAVLSLGVSLGNTNILNLNMGGGTPGSPTGGTFNMDGGTITNLSTGSAPSTQGLISLPLNTYGGTTNMMGDPDGWLVINGKKVPYYN